MKITKSQLRLIIKEGLGSIIKEELGRVMSEVKVRKLVRKMLMARMHEQRKRPSLVDVLFEEEEKEASGKIGGTPKGTAVDKTTNVKDVDPIEIANQLLSGDDNSPIVQSTQGEWFATSGAQAKEWIEKIGPEVFIKRLNDLAAKIPTTGLPKSVMPFLPGPEDAKGSYSDVEDALTPGGKYNVDVKDPFKEAWKRGARFLMEEEEKEVDVKLDKSLGRPPAPNTFVGMDAPGAKEFMKAGLEDGEDDDDKITIVKGGSIDAIKAIPTQSNILIYKALGMAMNPKNQIAGGELDAWAGTGGEILDGHHRWAATMFNDPSASMGTAGQVDLGALDDPQDVLRYLTAIGNALGNKTKTESFAKAKDDLIIEKWQRLAGIINEEYASICTLSEGLVGHEGDYDRSNPLAVAAANWFIKNMEVTHMVGGEVEERIHDFLADTYKLDIMGDEIFNVANEAMDIIMKQEDLPAGSL